jgi:hypothetical protein
MVYKILIRQILSSLTEAASRMPAGHPEGYIDGFANLYRDAAELIAARREGRPPSRWRQPRP